MATCSRSRNGTGVAYPSNFFDTTGRLASTQLRSNDHSVLNLHGYAYNAAHQRVLGTRTNVSVGASYSLRAGYGYDDAGQLTVAWVTNSAGSLVSGESRGYAYDPAQNLARRTNNAGGSTVSATVNALNQLTSGLGFSGSFNYDRRGNLLSIGSAGSGRAFAYDHENQCVTAGWFNAYNKSDFVYDGKGRLRKRTDYTWNGSSWTPTGETRYVYDGMLLIQERTSAGHPTVTYTRGSDLSGSLAGAGGIGGLLARTAHSSTSPYQPSTHAYYHADGNGNVTYLLNQARSHGASYRYDPYGRLIASSGPLASANLLRFSSKLWHDHSETYYYGYRFYLPEGQRWINRDPIGERGGFNLYEFSLNEPVNLVDPWGLRVSYDENGDIELDGSTTAGESVRRDRRTQDVHDALNEQALKDAGKALEVACIFLPWDKPFRFLRGLKAAKSANLADNVADAARLRNQLASQEIAGGHAFGKHVVKEGQFPGITTPQQFGAHIENIINNPSAIRHLSNGRTAYWDSASGTVVIRNPGAIDGGTAFKPTQGKTYFDNLK